MRSRTKSRVVLAVIAVVATLAYAVVVDLGIHAGRIHRGVEIEGGIAVGGLTVNEAVEKLSEIGTQIEQFPLVFMAPGFDCRFTAEELGWRSRPFSTAQAALRVGREDAPFGALVDRMKAWFGTSVSWADAPSARKLGKRVQQCEKLGLRFGVVVDKPQLRFRIKRAIVQWPLEQRHDIPMVEP